MEEYNKAAWEELIERCEATGVDAFEINFSCPHGMPERRMGMAMGQDCELLEVRRMWPTPKGSLSMHNLYDMAIIWNVVVTHTMSEHSCKHVLTYCFY
jgi:hypothetical protein